MHVFYFDYKIYSPQYKVLTAYSSLHQIPQNSKSRKLFGKCSGLGFTYKLHSVCLSWRNGCDFYWIDVFVDVFPPLDVHVEAHDGQLWDVFIVHVE